MIKIRNLEFEYFDRDEEGNLTDMINAIRGINFDVKKGDFVAIAGRNGSGKSTFARILNRLLPPLEGSVIIGGYDAMDADNIIDIRKKVGMVFQNPDDQLIGSVVEEDVAFGAENLLDSRKELLSQLDFALDKTGLKAYRFRKINELSGGEKQKVAIAGVLAMNTECIVLDEATSMLDGVSKANILSLIKRLNSELGITIIMITHDMDELLLADRIYIFEHGRIVFSKPKELLIDSLDKLYEYGLKAPAVLEIALGLRKAGVLRRDNYFSVKTLAEAIKKEHPNSFYLETTMPECNVKKGATKPSQAILVDRVSFSYGRNNIIRDLSFSIKKGEYVVVTGLSGAGKSTILQLVAGIIKPTSGSVYIDGKELTDKRSDRKKIRSKIGYLFQYPEQQLFGNNAYEDVVYGTRNQGLTEVEAEKRAYEAIKLVGLSDEIYDMPIEQLSGGLKRRLALAGVLAMKPEYLILDEPLAGLDPEGAETMLSIVDALHKESDMTIIMVSHNLDAFAGRADKLIDIEKGKIVYEGPFETAFYSMFRRDGQLDRLPAMEQLLITLRQAGMEISLDGCDIEEGIKRIIGNASY